VELEEIRSSGLLELYVLDQLSPAEKAEVETHLGMYPELRKDLNEIERSFEVFAASAAIQPPPGVKERILVAIRKDRLVEPSVKPHPGSWWPAVAAIFALGLLVLGYLFYQQGKDKSILEKQFITFRDTCDTRTNDLTRQIEFLRQFTDPNNRILAFQATPGFSTTDLYLHINPVTKKNFIQVRNLPDIASNQSFELWSIKGSEAPARLDVFDAPAIGLLEVAFVEGTDVYAITIEPKGGKDTPTMENLIGTVSVAGI
jgi:anti-sigma-K factor RskA